MKVFALSDGILHQIVVCETRDQVGETQAHPIGGLVRVYETVVVGAPVVAEANAGVFALNRRLENVDGF